MEEINSNSIKLCLEKLGYKLSSHGNHWRSSAVYRGGNNPTAIQIYKNSGTWKDFVEGTPYLPFTALIEATLKTNDKEVIKSYINSDDLLVAHADTAPKIDHEKVYDLNVLDRLLPHYGFYEQKGIDASTLKFLKSGLATEGKLYQRFVFPIFNENFDIHGFSGRDMMNNDNRPKWKHLGRKSTWVYPIYVRDSSGEQAVLLEIQKNKSIILIESIGDLLSLHQNSIKNCAVVFGLSIGSKLLSKLVSLGLKHVHICLNNDSDSLKNRGEIASVKMYLKLLDFFDKDSLFINLPIKNDFGDMDPDDFVEWQSSLNRLCTTSTQSLVRDVSSSLINSGELSSRLASNLKILHV